MFKEKTAILMVMFFLFSSFSFAAVIITNRTGNIKIIMPDKTEVVVSADEELPNIPDGAIIEILSETCEISVTDNSNVQVTVRGTTAYLDSGDSILAGFELETSKGYIACMAGKINVVSPNGNVTLDSTSPVFYLPTEKLEEKIEIEENARDISPSG